MPGHYWLVTCGAALDSLLFLAGGIILPQEKASD